MLFPCGAKLKQLHCIAKDEWWCPPRISNRASQALRVWPASHTKIPQKCSNLGFHNQYQNPCIAKTRTRENAITDQACPHNNFRLTLVRHGLFEQLAQLATLLVDLVGQSWRKHEHTLLRYRAFHKVVNVLILESEVFQATRLIA